MSKPSLTIVLPTLNAYKDLVRFFDSYRRQSIDFSKIELLIIDGGSTDNTRVLATEYNARILENPFRLTEPGVAIGCQAARGDIVMILSSDHAFGTPSFLQTMIDVFQNKDIAAAFPKHDSGPGDTVISRYFNTFTDPFTHFVYGYAANARTFHKIYTTMVHTSVYDIYDYASHPVKPVIALAQGFTIRRKFLANRLENSDDILAIYRMIDEGKKLAYVYRATLFHYTIQSVSQFVRKTIRGVENALLRADSGITQRMSYLTIGQRIRMFLFAPYAFTICLPLLQSILRFIIEREPVWLYHWYVVILQACIMVPIAIRLKWRKNE